MIRKLLFAAAALILTVWASSSAEAVGTCSCTYCRISTGNCMVGAETWSCQDYYANFC